uniref:Putative secreted peptide n=1 Tax=Anopheles braziliensis TaxID=58242 RepID=A0A2M3ZNR5_9DIPT
MHDFVPFPFSCVLLQFAISHHHIALGDWCDCAIAIRGIVRTVQFVCQQIDRNTNGTRGSDRCDFCRSSSKDDKSGATVSVEFGGSGKKRERIDY